VSIRVERAFGEVVEGEAVVSEEGFSPRYDLDRWSGVITKPGHRLEGVSLKDKVCFFPTAKGGIAAGWAFYDIKWKKIAPKAFIFGVTNPVMVHGWSMDPHTEVATGDWVRVDPGARLVQVLRRQR